MTKKKEKSFLEIKYIYIIVCICLMAVKFI